MIYIDMMEIGVDLLVHPRPARSGDRDMHAERPQAMRQVDHMPLDSAGREIRAELKDTHLPPARYAFTACAASIPRLASALRVSTMSFALSATS